MAFLTMPFYGPAQPAADPAAYRAYGPDFALTALATRPDLFQNGAHLNRDGAIVASRLAADRLAPLVAAAMAKRQ